MKLNWMRGMNNEKLYLFDIKNINDLNINIDDNYNCDDQMTMKMT